MLAQFGTKIVPPTPLATSLLIAACQIVELSVEPLQTARAPLMSIQGRPDVKNVSFGTTPSKSSMTSPAVLAKIARSPMTDVAGPVTLPEPAPPARHTGLRPVTSNPRNCPAQAVGGGSGPATLPGAKNSPRPVKSLVLSQISRSIAMMSVIA